MMYMPDATRAMIELMEADASRLVHRNAFNVAAMSFTPAQLAEEIGLHVDDFEIDYEVDPVRQRIADSWPDSVDDRAAREEWGWQPEWDLASMTRDMLDNLRARLDPAR
jgi:nucleoside-diphosphate-sugar epimerase